jgi:hypothetical protein
MLTAEAIREQAKSLPHIRTENGIIFQLTGKTLSIARYLTRELKLIDLGWKDHQIRDLADKIEMDLNPANDDLVMCKTPEDYIEMYKAGSSCMTVGTNGYGHLKSICTSIWDEQKLWPTIWYHYNPHTQGVYLKYKGRPDARCFLLTGEGRGWHTSSGIYASTYECSGRLRRLLDQQGFKTIPYKYGDPNSGGKEKITQEFRVPGVLHLDKYYGAVPNCDDIVKPFCVSFDPVTKDFVFGPKGDHQISNTYNYGGWINQDQCK